MKSCESVEAFDMLERLFSNVSKNPHEQKFRKVKIEGNAKIKAAFESKGCTVELAKMIFKTHGWIEEVDEVNGEIYLKLPENVQQSFGDVREIVDSREKLQKELQAAFRRRVTARSKAEAGSVGCAASNKIKEQLEADKRERAAMGPITEGSKRVDGPLGNGGFQTSKGAGCCGDSNA
jgi:hypothetical protein